MTFLLGIQAMLGQEPPIYFRSITTARIPFLAKVQARYLPASPQPSTTRSYSSGCDMGFAFVELVDALRPFDNTEVAFCVRAECLKSLFVSLAFVGSQRSFVTIKFDNDRSLLQA